MNIKNTVTISLMIFIIIVIIILGITVYQNNTNSQSPVQEKNNFQTPEVTTDITMANVANHNTATDCWTVINNKVYNVTNLEPVHPGGSQAIVSSCGKDSTTAFETRYGKGPHPQRAIDALKTYYVGNLK